MHAVHNSGQLRFLSVFLLACASGLLVSAQEYKFSFSYSDEGAVTMNLKGPNGKKKGATVPVVRP